MMKTILSSLFLPIYLSSYVVGNFADPNLYKKGVSLGKHQPFSLRTSYFSDYIYKMELQDEFVTPDSDATELGITTYAGILTANFFERLDIYSILGSTKMHENELGLVPRKFSWCVGSKVVLLKWGDVFFGIDGKYFETTQKPCYYVLETGEPAFILNNLDFTYSETQIALGFAYQWSFFTGYLGATYLDARLTPNPRSIVLDIPSFGEDSAYEDDNLRNNVNRFPVGLVFGFTLLSEETMSLNVESRHIDQNDVSVYGTLRF